MTRPTRALLCVLVALGGCLAPRGMVRTPALAALMVASHPDEPRILERTDAYVAGDDELVPAARAAYHAHAARLRELLEAETAPARLLAEPVRAVCDLHDVYVLHDPALSDLEVRVYTDSTFAARRIIDEGAAP